MVLNERATSPTGQQRHIVEERQTQSLHDDRFPLRNYGEVCIGSVARRDVVQRGVLGEGGQCVVVGGNERQMTLGENDSIETVDVTSDSWTS